MGCKNMQNDKIISFLKEVQRVKEAVKKKQQRRIGITWAISKYSPVVVYEKE